MLRRRSMLLAGVWALGHAPFADGAPPPLKLVIVTQKGSPLGELSLRALKRMYMGETQIDSDGSRLTPLNQALSSPGRVVFESLVLGMSSDTVARYWIDRRIRGQPGPPKAVTPVALLVQTVASVPGTLTYLREADFDPSLKVLTIDGKRPIDAGYALTIE
jgi:hypothetical protein